jgi:hypothetical protein
MKVAADWREWHVMEVDRHVSFFDDPDPQVRFAHMDALAVMIGWEFEIREGVEKKHVASVNSFRHFWKRERAKWGAKHPGGGDSRIAGLAEFYLGTRRPVKVPSWAGKTAEEKDASGEKTRPKKTASGAGGKRSGG